MKDDSLRICVLSTDFSKYSETFVQSHIKFFGGSVKLKIGYSRFQESSGVRYLNLRPKNYFFKICDLLFSVISFLIFRRKWFFNPLRERLVFSEIKYSRVNVVIVEFSNLFDMVARACRKAGVPVVVFYRGVDASSLLKSWKTRDSIIKSCQESDLQVFVADFLRRNVIGAGGDPRNYIVLPSGVDLDLVRYIPPRNGLKKFVFVGRFVDKKDPLMTIRVFEKLLEKDCSREMVFVGGGDLEPILREYCEKNSLGSRVSFSGILPQSDVLKLLEESDALLFFPRASGNGSTEGMPCVIQESMAAGCLVVTTNHAGIPEFVSHGLSGLVFDLDIPCEPPTFIAEHIERLHVSEVQEMVRQARSVAWRHFDRIKILTLLEQKMKAKVLECKWVGGDCDDER